MGRNAAGESFLKGFLKHSKSDIVWIYVETPDHAQAFKEEHGKICQNREIRFLGPEQMEELGKPGCLFYPGPNLNSLALNRHFFGSNSWSLCGITHTTASQQAMNSIVDIPTSHLEAWDALICPSPSVKGHVGVMLNEQGKFLKEHLGLTCEDRLQIPVIPLGIHTEDFHSTDSERLSARSRLGISSEDLVVLYVGRLSFHAKAHPLPMYEALETASQTVDNGVVLIETGWHGNEHIRAAFKEGAQSVCPNVRVIQLDGRKPIERKEGWASADIFCSLADNIQETFGIVPIEAMAAGLPVVVSDWDGYRDSVRDEIDGFRIPTFMPPEGCGEDLAFRHASGVDSYDRYCGNTSSLISVDIDAATDAFIKLFKSTDLREEMGFNGRDRAKNVFDWEVIIPKYEDLWQSLADKRRTLKPIYKSPLRIPSRLDPFYAFSGYPTRLLEINQRLALRHPDKIESLKQLDRYKELTMVNYANYILPKDDESKRLINLLGNETKTIAELLGHFSDENQTSLYRMIAWLLKLGIVTVLK